MDTQTKSLLEIIPKEILHIILFYLEIETINALAISSKYLSANCISYVSRHNLKDQKIEDIKSICKMKFAKENVDFKSVDEIMCLKIFECKNLEDSRNRCLKLIYRKSEMIKLGSSKRLSCVISNSPYCFLLDAYYILIFKNHKLSLTKLMKISKNKVVILLLPLLTDNYSEIDEIIFRDNICDKHRLENERSIIFGIGNINISNIYPIKRLHVSSLIKSNSVFLSPLKIFGNQLSDEQIKLIITDRNLINFISSTKTIGGIGLLNKTLENDNFRYCLSRVINFLSRNSLNLILRNIEEIRKIETNLDMGITLLFIDIKTSFMKMTSMNATKSM